MAFVSLREHFEDTNIELLTKNSIEDALTFIAVSDITQEMLVSHCYPLHGREDQKSARIVRKLLFFIDRFSWFDFKLFEVQNFFFKL